MVLAAPVPELLGLARRALAAAPDDCVVTDIGSTKSGILEALTPAERGRFIGGHPVCGGERTGVAFAREDLFQGATWFLTPGAGGAVGSVRPAPRPRRRGRRPPRRDRRRRARPPDGARLAPAARPGGRARQPGRRHGARRPRGPALGRPVVHRPDPGRRLESAPLGGHPARQLGIGARRAARLHGAARRRRGGPRAARPGVAARLRRRRGRRAGAPASRAARPGPRRR